MLLDVSFDLPNFVQEIKYIHFFVKDFVTSFHHFHSVVFEAAREAKVVNQLIGNRELDGFNFVL